MSVSSSSTAAQVLEILLLFNQSRGELSAEEIGDKIGASRSTTYRYLRTLLEKGFLEKRPSGKYFLGDSFLSLGRVAHRNNDLAQVALPVMEQLVEMTHETVLLSRKSGRYSVCIERVEGPSAVRITFEKGAIQPLHAGASSKILLAYASKEEQERYLAQPLEAFTDSTQIDPEKLRRELDEIRRDGYCLTDGEVDFGAVAISVPIMNQQNRMVAALSLAGPVFRMDESTCMRYLPSLKESAHRIEKEYF